MRKAIGILGGMGPQASARLYQLLIEGTKTYMPAAVDDEYPEIVLLNVPVPNFISDKDKLPEARQMLIERAQLLENAGCVVNGIACNTAHILLPELQKATNVPFLSIPKLVAAEVEHRKLTRVGLLGSPTTLASKLYDDELASDVLLVRPPIKLARQTEKHIYKQLQNKISKSDNVAFRRLVSEFRESEKLDAVILGCTELPLIYGETDEHIIDTLRVLSDGLLNAYFSSLS